MEDDGLELSGLRDVQVMHKVCVAWAKLRISAVFCSLREKQKAKFEIIRQEAIAEMRKYSLCEQGDMEMYTVQHLMERANLKRDPLIRLSVDAFWNITQLSKSSDNNHLTKEGYIQLNRMLHLALVPIEEKEVLERSVLVDWKKDSQGNEELSYDLFFESMFELVDIWCEEIDSFEYVAFLDRVLDAIAVRDVNGDVHLRKVDQVKTLITDEDMEEVTAMIQNLPMKVPARKGTSIAFSSNKGWGDMRGNRRLSVLQSGLLDRFIAEEKMILGETKITPRPAYPINTLNLESADTKGHKKTSLGYPSQSKLPPVTASKKKSTGYQSQPLHDASSLKKGIIGYQPPHGASNLKKKSLGYQPFLVQKDKLAIKMSGGYQIQPKSPPAPAMGSPSYRYHLDSKGTNKKNQLRRPVLLDKSSIKIEGLGYQPQNSPDLAASKNTSRGHQSPSQEPKKFRSSTIK